MLSHRFLNCPQAPSATAIWELAVSFTVANPFLNQTLRPRIELSLIATHEESSCWAVLDMHRGRK